MPSTLELDISMFKERVLDDEVCVLDPPTQHHEFTSKAHGRKLDFDKIVTGSDFYMQWTKVYADWIRYKFRHRMPDAVIGVADGANRLSRSIAPLLGDKILGLTTVKDNENRKIVHLDEIAKFAIREYKPRFVLIIEDVGTTGSTTVNVVNELIDEEVPLIETVTTWQRSAKLPMLDALRTPYSSMIPEPLPTFSPEACLNDPAGFCFNGVLFIPRS